MRIGPIKINWIGFDDNSIQGTYLQDGVRYIDTRQLGSTHYYNVEILHRREQRIIRKICRKGPEYKIRSIKAIRKRLGCSLLEAKVYSEFYGAL